jgi:hypothetical protein
LDESGGANQSPDGRREKGCVLAFGMHARRKDITPFALAILLWSVTAHSVVAGQSLSSALEELRAGGLRLVFSSALVRPELTVDPRVDVVQGTPEDIARRILAPHGLTLEAIRPGLFSVVRLNDASAQGRAPTAGAETPPPSQRAPAADEPLYEVDVYASRYVIDDATPSAALAELTREDVEALPGLNQDVMRVTRFLPGTASNALSARSHVRGGRDDELAVFFDGVPLFEPFHYKDVQSLLGLLDPGSISKVDFFSGVVPAHYGNRLSGVLDIAPRTWSGRNYNEIGASVLYTHGLTQGRLESHPIEWLATARRGNIEELTKLVGHEETKPDFLDALVRVKWDTGPRSSLAAGWLLLDDTLTTNLNNGVERGEFEYRDATGWTTWRFRPGDESELRATMSRTERHTTREGALNRPGSAVGSLEDRRIFDTTTFRLEGSAKAGHRTVLNGGVEWYDYHANYDYRSLTQLDPFLASVLGSAPLRANASSLRVEGAAYAAFASALLNVSRDVSIDLAWRWDAQRFGPAFHDNQLSPRLSVQYQFDPATILRLSWGRMAQTERPDELQVQDGEPYFHAAQRSVQTVFSLERRIRDSTLLRIETYDKRVTDPTPLYENLFDPFALLPELEADRTRVQPRTSRIYGAELSLRWQLPRAWSGWTSYSWSEATDHFGAASALRTWDQKHSIATGLAWTSGAWQLSGNVNWHSGWRRNALVETQTGAELAPRNSLAWPDYLSLDLRATWTRSLPKGRLEVFGEIDNASNHSNPCCVSYSASSAGGITELSPEASTWLPRLYLIGVTWQLP